MQRRLSGVVAVFLLVIAGCGDDDAASSTSAPTTSVTTSSVVTSTTTSTALASTTTQAATTSTTAATTTTTTLATTTQPTTPPDAHPVLGGPSWESLWPAEGATATYRVVDFQGNETDVQAHFEYGVDFEGTTLDRIVFGSGEPGADGLAVYFDRSEPWVFKIRASQVFRPSTTQRAFMTESFESAQPFDLSGAVGEPSQKETTVRLIFSDGATESFGVTYRTTLLAVGESLEVPFGALDGVVHVQSVVGGDFMGGTEFVSEMWFHPEHLLVRMTGSPAWDDILLVSPFA